MRGKLAARYPRYVSVYDALLSDIQAESYPPGAKLPGENELSKRFGVSRNTLRQALMLLQEDGYLSIRQGRGNIVLRGGGSRRASVGRLDNPLISMSAEPVDGIDTSIEIRKISPKHQLVFGLDPSKLLVLIRIVCSCGGKKAGCALAFVPYDAVAAENVPLDDMRAVYGFYDRYLSSDGFSSEGTLRIAYARDPVTGLLEIPRQQALLMLDDVVLSGSGAVAMTQKLFFMPDVYELRLTRRNDRKAAGR